MKKTWKEAKIDYLEFFFKKDAERWEPMSDDRRLFHNMYNQIMEAINSLPNKPNNYVCVALNRLIGEDIKTMKEIQERFNGK